MPPRSQRPIEESDIREFVVQASDFSFEMRILKRLTDWGFTCEHGGTYNDPVTRKPRQFDIRARRDEGSNEPHFVVECKNIRPESPLLVHTMKRQQQEAYHDLVWRRGSPWYTSVFRADGGASAYWRGDPVGKQTDQVQRRDGSFKSADGEVFEKLQQAVNGCHDVVEAVARTGKLDCFHAIIPIVIVPDGLLWSIHYQPDGSQAGDPQRIDAMTLYLGQVWSVPSLPQHPFRISHLEIVTESGLGRRLNALLGIHGLFRRANEVASGG